MSGPGVEFRRRGSLSVQMNNHDSLQIDETRPLVIAAHWKLHKQCDLDLTLLLFDQKGRYLEAVNFMTVHSHDNAIQHMGDNVTGITDGDDELVKVQLDKVSARVSVMVIVISCFNGKLDVAKSLRLRLLEQREEIMTTAGRKKNEVEVCNFHFQVCNAARLHSWCTLADPTN
jgi:stress response protein SCP2